MKRKAQAYYIDIPNWPAAEGSEWRNVTRVPSRAAALRFLKKHWNIPARHAAPFLVPAD